MTISKDGYRIDDETGEVLGLAEQPEAFRVTEEEERFSVDTGVRPGRHLDQTAQEGLTV